MARYFRKKAVLAKIESVYGTDAVPTGAANAILTKQAAISLMQGGTVKRDLDRPTMGGEQELHVSPYSTISYMVEAAGAGAAGTAPAYSPLLLACGFAETINAGVDVQYDPVSAAFDSLSQYFSMDGIKHALLGCRGKLKLTLSPGGIPMLSFDFTGLRVAPADTADPTLTTTAWQVPIPVTNAATPTFSLHGYAANMIALELDMGTVVVYRNVVGEESVQITDRDVSGSVTIEEPLLATKDFHAICAAHTLGAMQFIHGTAAGSIFQVDAGQVQVLEPQIGETDGIATLQMKLKCIPTDAGDDEIKITVK